MVTGIGGSWLNPAGNWRRPLVDSDLDLYQLQQKLKAAVEEVVRGSDYAPAAGEGNVLIDCVVIMGWSDTAGNYGSTYLRCGSPWATEGLIQQIARDLEADDDQE